MNRRAVLQGLLGLSAATTCGFAGRALGSNQTYVQMGTSITAGLRAPGAYQAPAVVGERLHMDAVNVGFEGACAGIGISGDYDQISLYALSNAIISADWSAQDSAVPRISRGEDAAGFGETKPPILRKLKAVDFSRVTYIGLEYGTNDFTLNAPMGKNTDTSGATFKGALNYSVRRLMAAHPETKLFFITPAWFLDYEDRDTNLCPNKAGFFVRDYVDAMIEIADLNGIKCLDMWRRLGINERNYREFTYDSKHPNAAGAILRGELTAAFIKSMW